MNKSGLYNRVISFIHQIEWKLLVFLILFINLKLGIKICAILVMYLLQFNFRFQLRFRLSRLPLFYVIMIGIAVLNRLLNGNYSAKNENIAFLIGLSFWLLCLLAVHQLKLIVDRTPVQKIHYTIIVFFLINALFSFANILAIMWETGALNPYLYQGKFQKYFIGTGDNIRGVSFDVSTTNAILNCFGVVYFLSRKNYLMSFLCMIVLLMTTSNFTNFMVTGALIYIFLFLSDRSQKSAILMCLFFLILFVIKVSPQNNTYALDYFTRSSQTAKKPDSGQIKDPLAFMEKPDSLLTMEEKKKKIARLYLDSLGRELRARMTQNEKKIFREDLGIMDAKPTIPEPDINGKYYQRKSETTAIQQNLILFQKKEYQDKDFDSNKLISSKKPGKFISFQETYQYLRNDTWKWITGAGMGNFSSKLAFKTSALGITGYYPVKLHYINKAFEENHLPLYLFYFTRDQRFHSITNMPNSVFNQLAGEYGFAGIMAFIIFYLGFFFKRKKLKAFLPYLMILTGAFLMEYWFEQLSIVILFELLMFLEIKESNQIATS
jgi:hypothetical protein